MKAPVSLFRMVASFKKYLIRGRSALISQPACRGCPELVLALPRGDLGWPSQDYHTAVADAGAGARAAHRAHGFRRPKVSVKVIFKVRDGRRRGKRPTGQGSVERDGGLACAEAGHSGPARRGSPPGRRTCGVTRSRAGSRQVSGTGASLPGGSTLRVRSSSLYVSLSRGNLPFNVHKRCWDDRFI